MSEPVGRTALARGTLDLQWEHGKTSGNQRVLVAHAGQDPLRLVDHLAAARKSYGFLETFENVAQTIGFHNWPFGSAGPIKGSTGLPSGRSECDALL